jgi:hypothetical protein
MLMQQCLRLLDVLAHRCPHLANGRSANAPAHVPFGSTLGSTLGQALGPLHKLPSFAAPGVGSAIM